MQEDVLLLVLNANTTGTCSVAFGEAALFKNTSCCNTAIGNRALQETTTAPDNTFIGRCAGALITTAGYNMEYIPSVLYHWMLILLATNNTTTSGRTALCLICKHNRCL